MLLATALGMVHHCCCYLTGCKACRLWASYTAYLELGHIGLEDPVAVGALQGLVAGVLRHRVALLAPPRAAGHALLLQQRPARCEVDNKAQLIG